MVREIFIGAIGLRFDSRAGRIGRSVANGWPPLRRICVAQALGREDGPTTRDTLRRNTASIMGILFVVFCDVIKSYDRAFLEV